MEIAVRECAILIRPAFLVIPMRSLAAVILVVPMIIYLVVLVLVDIWDLALKDPDTMRVLQQNQQLALRIIILADLVLADIMTARVLMII